MEVILCTQDDGFIFRNALDLVSPLAGDFDTCLDSLGTGVHRHHHVKAKVASNKLGKAGEDIIVKSTGTQGNSRSLVYQCSNQFGVAVTLVHSGVGGEEVKVVTAFRVPDRSTLSPGKDHRKRVVVVGSIFLLGFNGLSRRGSMIVGERPVSSHGGLRGELRSWGKLEVMGGIGNGVKAEKKEDGIEEVEEIEEILGNKYGR